MQDQRDLARQGDLRQFGNSPLGDVYSQRLSFENRVIRASKTLTKGNLAQALVWYSRAAEQGDIGAQVALGLAYAQGIGVVQDYLEADKWFNIAASRANSADELADIATRHTN